MMEQQQFPDVPVSRARVSERRQQCEFASPIGQTSARPKWAGGPAIGRWRERVGGWGGRGGGTREAGEAAGRRGRWASKGSEGDGAIAGEAGEVGQQEAKGAGGARGARRAKAWVQAL